MELSPVVNRDLSRRVRPVAGAALAKQAIRHDIKLAARLIREFDKRAALYEKETKEETEAREKAEKEAAEVKAIYSLLDLLNLLAFLEILFYLHSRHRAWRIFSIVLVNKCDPVQH